MTLNLNDSEISIMEKKVSDFRYGSGMFSCGSDLNSPIESVAGSTETESDEDDCIAVLTRQMGSSSFDDCLKVPFSGYASENTKAWVMAGSKQSTMCAYGNGCGCKQGTSRGSPTGPLASSPTSWDLLYSAAEQGKACFRSVSQYQKQYEAVKYQEMLKKQSEAVWGQNVKTAVPIQQLENQNHQMGAARNGNRHMGLSSSAWPFLKQPPFQQNGSGTRSAAFFLGETVPKRECAGTGVFLPRRGSYPPESRKRAASSTPFPVRVVPALNLNLEERFAAPSPYHFSGGLTSRADAAAVAAMRRRIENNNALAQAQLRRKPVVAFTVANQEIILPQEWTY